jgi:hypothetical protein
VLDTQQQVMALRDTMPKKSSEEVPPTPTPEDFDGEQAGDPEDSTEVAHSDLPCSDKYQVSAKSTSALQEAPVASEGHADPRPLERHPPCANSFRLHNQFASEAPTTVTEHELKEAPLPLVSIEDEVVLEDSSGEKVSSTLLTTMIVQDVSPPDGFGTKALHSPSTPEDKGEKELCRDAEAGTHAINNNCELDSSLYCASELANSLRNVKVRIDVFRYSIWRMVSSWMRS